MPRPKIVNYPHVARFAPDPPDVIAGDGAVNIDYDGSVLLTKGSAAAITVAAPGAKNVGRIKRITTGSDFAHVVTFTGSTLRDGTTGASITWTAAAFRGSSLVIQAVDAATWNVIGMNLGAIV